LDEHGILDRDYSWSTIVLNFEFLLGHFHDDVTWDCPKMEDLGKRRIILGHCFEGVRIVVGILE
jgi:hypothetical protein